VRPAASGWLPELCRWEPFLVILLGAELVAVVAVLAPMGSIDAGRTDWWVRIGPVSLYVQWLTLTCTVCLCVLRTRLLRLPALLGGVVAWLQCTLICLLGAIAIGMLDRELGLGMTGTGQALPQFVFGSTASAAVLAAAALRYAFVHNQWRQQVQAHARAEADALQARIRPHFLFNSLNTIASLISVRPAAAESALLDLSDLFRASLRAGAHSLRLEEEVALGKRYLAIEQERLGERLQQSWSLDLPDDLELPPLSLQPLLENAVYHGIQALPEGGEVRVSGRRSGEHWLIEVRNPIGPGGSGHRGSGQAVANIRARLRHRFGDRADLTCEQGSDYHLARLWIPMSPDVS
jgi:two-component system sensor histidine kinase AlgZ